MKGKITSLIWLLCAMPLLASEGGESVHLSPVVEYGAKTLNFIIFAWILYYFLREPIRNFFVGRLSRIKESLELAERSREEAKRRLEEIESKMSTLDSELAAIETQAREDAEREKQRIHDEARRESQRILDQAKAEIENMQRHALMDLRHFVVELAANDAESRLKTKLSAKDKTQVFEEFSSYLGAKS